MTPNGLPKETVDYLKLLFGSGTTILDGEDCEEAIVEASCSAESNSDDSCRFDSQCRFTIPGRTWFKAPGCSGVYSVIDILSLLLIVITRFGSGYMEVRLTQYL